MAVDTFALRRELSAKGWRLDQEDRRYSMIQHGEDPKVIPLNNTTLHGALQEALDNLK